MIEKERKREQERERDPEKENDKPLFIGKLQTQDQKR